MARRRAKKRRSRTRTFSVLNAIESYAYASIITEGLFSATPIQFLTAPDNIWQGAYDPAEVQTFFLQNPDQGYVSGANPLSLRDLISNPGFAANAIIGRGRANVIPMVFSAATVNFGMRLFKRAMRKPIANVNRNLVKPMLGAGIRL